MGFRRGFRFYYKLSIACVNCYIVCLANKINSDDDIIFSISLAFCKFLTITQRMCLAVSPWTLVLMVFLDCKERRRIEKELITGSPGKDDPTCKNNYQMKKERQLLDVKNLQVCPGKNSNTLLLEDDQLKDHHKRKLAFIWGMSLVCGICSEQVMDQSKNLVCSLIRERTSPLEIFSILLTYPIPALFTIFPLMISLYMFPNSNIQSQSLRTRTTCVTLSLCYLLSILPSMLVDLMDTNNNLILALVIKYNLSSIHVIFEPLVILFMRPSLATILRLIFGRRNP